MAKVGRKTKFERYEISDDLIVDIPEIDPGLVHPVISLDKAWPVAGLEGQPYRKWGVEDRQMNTANPTVQLIQYEGRFFAPVMVFQKQIGVGDAAPATPDMLADIGDNRTVWATGFEKIYDHQTLKPHFYESDTWLHLHHRTGDLMRTGDKRIKELQEGQEYRRDEAIVRAREDAERYISIEGQLWRALRDEPVFKFQFNSGIVSVEVTDDHFINWSPRWGLFRLDRHQDCLDHINDIARTEHGGTGPIVEYFENLVIDPTCELVFDDEAKAILTIAHETIQRMQRFTNGMGIQQTPLELQDVHKRLRSRMGQDKEKHLDEIAETLRESQKVWPHENYAVPGLDLVLQRWDMRPVMGHAASPLF